jgi:putative serine protease PepD
MRSLRPGGAVLTTLIVLLSAGAGYAAVSLVRSDVQGSLVAGHAPVASAPARTAAPAWLGVDTMNSSPAGGAVVVDVVPGSPAERAGLQPGDLITQIGNRPVHAPRDLESALAGMHAGQQIEIGYEQGPTSYTTHTTLRARPSNGP